MKILILIRHAKSSWDRPEIKDFDRALNERGKKDASEMAKRLKEKNIKINLFITSTAKRARKTAIIFAELFKVKKNEICLSEKLYMAGEKEFEQLVGLLDDKYDAVAMVSHNSGITEYANSLSSVKVNNMPTSSFFAVAGDTDSWKNFAVADKKFLFFDYPKNIHF